MRQAFIVITLFLVCLIVFSVSAYAQDEVKIVYTKGNVKLQRSSDDFWILAKKGMLLKENDKIKTFIASEAEIALDSTLKNIVKLDQNTEISIEDIKAKKLSMLSGKVFVLVESLPSDSSFEVRTPTAAAGVAGSGMSVGTDGKSTTVSCFEDKAFVRGVNIDGTLMAEIVIIDNGFKRVVGRFEMPGDVMMLTALDRQGWTQFRENLRDHIDRLRNMRAQGSRGAAVALEEIQRIQERASDRLFDDKENIYEEREPDRRDDWEPPPPSGRDDSSSGSIASGS